MNIETKLKILNETAASFNAETRAFEPVWGACKYWTADGRRCAVGRLLSPEAAKSLQVCCDNRADGGEGTVNDDLVWSRLPMDVKALGRDFLANLQKLHDDVENWNETGLSEKGVEVVAQLREEFEAN